MLVLTRKCNQRVFIGEHIAITVLECRGDRVRLGIAAPVEVPVFREEVLRRKTAGSAEPAPWSPSELESPYFSECA